MMQIGIAFKIGTFKRAGDAASIIYDGNENFDTAAVFAWQCPHRQSGESGTRNAVRRKIWRTYCVGAY